MQWGKKREEDAGRRNSRGSRGGQGGRSSNEKAEGAGSRRAEWKMQGKRRKKRNEIAGRREQEEREEEEREEEGRRKEEPTKEEGEIEPGGCKRE